MKNNDFKNIFSNKNINCCCQYSFVKNSNNIDNIKSNIKMIYY